MEVPLMRAFKWLVYGAIIVFALIYANAYFETEKIGAFFKNELSSINITKHRNKSP